VDMNVALKIVAGVSGQQAVDQLRTSMERLGDGANDVAGRFNMLKGAIAGLAASAVVGGFVAMIKSAIDMGDKLNDLSQKTGIAVEDLDALGYVAEQNGSNLDAVAGALGKLAKNMAEAAGGSKEAVATFKQFGISQAEIKNGSITTTEALARISERLGAMPDGWQKTAAAQQVFGKSAADLVPLLNAGADAIRNARAELEGYGALFDGGFARASDEFNDSMSRLRRVAGAVSLSFARELLPVLTGFVKGIAEARAKADDLAGDTSLQFWAENLALSIAAVVDVVRVAGQGFYALLGSGRAVLADMGAIGSILSKGPAALFSEQSRAELKAALENRNAIVADANQRYVDLWKMDGSKFYTAVKGAMDKAKEAAKEPAVLKPGGAGGMSFDFSAGKDVKESAFDKLKKQLDEQLAKTGDLTRAQEVLNQLKLKEYADVTPQQRAELLRLAAKIDYTKQITQDSQDLAKAEADRAKARDEQYKRENDAIGQLMRSKQGELELTRMEGQQAELSAREYEKLVDAKRHELQVSEAVRNMLPENAARYREVADAMFAAKQAAEDLNYQQSRTFETGARRAMRNYLDDITNVAKVTEDAMANAFRGMEDALVQFTMTGKLNFKSLANSIIQDLIRIYVQQTIMKPLLGAIGGMFGGGTFANGAGGFELAGSLGFDGGGYTGSGPRSGGLDGKGGFLAVMHPQETVIDHTKGQGMGNTSVVVNVNVESGSEQVTTDEGAGHLGRMIAGVVKAELIQQKRPGGLLAA